MNIIAIDIGNTNVTTAFFLKDEEQFIESIGVGSDEGVDKLKKVLVSAWEQIPFVKSDKVEKRDGVIVVSSVKDEWTSLVAGICDVELGEKIQLIGRDVPFPIELGVDNPEQVGSDRVVSAAAAYVVVEDAVAIADFGTAVTIDLVDDEGVFLGGVIAPGFEMGANALNVGTERLPRVVVEKPKDPIGGNTEEAINCGLYYSAVGLLETVVRKYAEQLGKWPHLIVTGGAGEVIKGDCDFVDSWVPSLAVKGVVLTYKKFLEEKS